MSRVKGFTIVEILVATAIMTLCVGALAGMFSLFNVQFFTIRDRLEAEGVATDAENLLKQVLSQAISLDTTGGPIPAAIGAGRGLILSPISFTSIAATPAGINTLAVFNRETGQLLSPTGVGPAPINNGTNTATAIWYIRPTAGPNGTSGVIFVAQSDPGVGMSPSYSTTFIDRVSYLTIVSNTHPNYGTVPGTLVTSVDVHLKIRYTTNYANGYNWCPLADIVAATPGCATPMTNAEVDRQFSVVIRNNMLHPSQAASGASSVSQEERTLGNLYFFRPYVPPQ